MVYRPALEYTYQYTVTTDNEYCCNQTVKDDVILSTVVIKIDVWLSKSEHSTKAPVPLMPP